jgi:biopolymer transport protein ExbD
MKTLVLLILAAILMTTYVYTENQIKMNIKRNDKGEIILSINGQSTPIVIEMDGKSTTYNVGDGELNLDEALSLELDTASGTEQSSIDTQIPPVSSNINSNPPEATPY